MIPLRRVQSALDGTMIPPGRAEWPAVFGGDEKLTTALLDRLAERATIIATRGKSYRMRRRKRATASEPPSAEPAKRPASHSRQARKE